MNTLAWSRWRWYSRADIAVSLRILRALGDIAIADRDPAFRRTLFELGKRVVEGCGQALGEEHMGPMHTRLSALEKIVAPFLPR